MKKFLKILKKIGIVLISILVLAIVVLLIIGVPKPPAITAKNIPRLPLSHLKKGFEVSNQTNHGAWFTNWDKTSNKMLVYNLMVLIMS